MGEEFDWPPCSGAATRYLLPGCGAERGSSLSTSSRLLEQLVQLEFFSDDGRLLSDGVTSRPSSSEIELGSTLVLPEDHLAETQQLEHVNSNHTGHDTLTFAVPNSIMAESKRHLQRLVVSSNNAIETPTFVVGDTDSLVQAAPQSSQQFAINSDHTTQTQTFIIPDRSGLMQGEQPYSHYIEQPDLKDFNNASKTVTFAIPDSNNTLVQVEARCDQQSVVKDFINAAKTPPSFVMPGSSSNVDSCNATSACTNHTMVLGVCQANELRDVLCCDGPRLLVMEAGSVMSGGNDTCYYHISKLTYVLKIPILTILCCQFFICSLDSVL